MKAVIFRQHGGPDVLEYADVPDPQAQPGQVIVRVKACALNHLDLWIRQGLPAYKLALPHISGCDVAGVIERVGADVIGLQPGDRVVLAPGISCGRCEWCAAGQDTYCASYGIRGAAVDGGYAELTAARAQDAFVLPETISFERAAAFPLTFLTAWHMLAARAKLQEGETVLVHAAGSGVGHAAVQIAKYLKATVYATVGSEGKLAKAKSLGADAVMLAGHEPFEDQVKALTGGRGVSVVFEHVGPSTWEGSVRCLAKGGRLVTCGATTGPGVPLDLRYVFSRQLTILGSMMGTLAELKTVSRLVFAGQLTPVIDTVFPLKQARQAQERMASRDVFGKLLLAP